MFVLSVAGLCRTCEIFGAKALVLDSLRHVNDKQFRPLSVFFRVVAADAGGCVWFLYFVRSVLFRLFWPNEYICCFKIGSDSNQNGKNSDSLYNFNAIHCLATLPTNWHHRVILLKQTDCNPFGATSSAEITHCIFKDILIFPLSVGWNKPRDIIHHNHALHQPNTFTTQNRQKL